MTTYRVSITNLQWCLHRWCKRTAPMMSHDPPSPMMTGESWFTLSPMMSHGSPFTDDES